MVLWTRFYQQSLEWSILATMPLSLMTLAYVLGVHDTSIKSPPIQQATPISATLQTRYPSTRPKRGPTCGCLSLVKTEGYRNHKPADEPLRCQRQVKIVVSTVGAVMSSGTSSTAPGFYSGIDFNRWITNGDIRMEPHPYLGRGGRYPEGGDDKGSHQDGVDRYLQVHRDRHFHDPRHREDPATDGL